MQNKGDGLSRREVVFGLPAVGLLAVTGCGNLTCWTGHNQRPKIVLQHGEETDFDGSVEDEHAWGLNVVDPDGGLNRYNFILRSSRGDNMTRVVSAQVPIGSDGDAVYNGTRVPLIGPGAVKGADFGDGNSLSLEKDRFALNLRNGDPVSYRFSNVGSSTRGAVEGTGRSVGTGTSILRINARDACGWGDDPLTLTNYINHTAQGDPVDPPVDPVPDVTDLERLADWACLELEGAEVTGNPRADTDIKLYAVTPTVDGFSYAEISQLALDDPDAGVHDHRLPSDVGGTYYVAVAGSALGRVSSMYAGTSREIGYNPSDCRRMLVLNPYLETVEPGVISVMAEAEGGVVGETLIRAKPATAEKREFLESLAA